ncbi:SANT/Myb_domain [Hexamita inflata]|uniref:SANT/Myb domain n=1 Tax=Hexamita inflata TaxID=28002 RepID=A0AA86Q7Y3_9EUKA|nr:SANT/Myb domain [Hexamita inflata]
MERSYKKWSEEDISKLISLCRSYKNKVINWAKIAGCIEGRSAQQCKSYYNSQIHQLERKLYNMAEKPAQFAERVLLKLACGHMEQVNSIKQIYFDNLMLDIVINIKMVMSDSKTFEFNKELLRTMMHTILLYQQQCECIANQADQSKILLQSTYVSKEQFKHLNKLMESINYKELYVKLVKHLKC